MAVKKGKSKAFIIAGVLLLLVAGGLFVYSRIDDHLAGLRAQRVLEQVLAGDWEVAVLNARNQHSASQGNAAGALDYPEFERDSEEAGEIPFANSVIGILEIHDLDITLPVFNSSTNAMLNISPGRYMGSLGEKPERLVIAGHNYRRHFGQISTLVPGDMITFTTSDGSVYHYEMIGAESIHMNDVTLIEACSEWDITLLTCEKDNTFRTLVRFREVL